MISSKESIQEDSQKGVTLVGFSNAQKAFLTFEILDFGFGVEILDLISHFEDIRLLV